MLYAHCRVPFSGRSQGISGRGKPRNWHQIPYLHLSLSLALGSMPAGGLSHKMLITGGHSKVGNALVPLSGAYYLPPVPCHSYLHTFVPLALRVETSLAHLYFSQGPAEILFFLQWYLMDVCAGVEFLFQAFSTVLGSVGLTCVSGIHSFSERDETHMVSPVSSTCKC